MTINCIVGGNVAENNGSVFRCERMEVNQLQIRKFECSGCKYSDYRMSAREIGETLLNECPRCGKSMEVTGAEPPGWLAKPLRLITKHFEVTDFVAKDNRIEVEVSARDPKRSFRTLLKVFRPRGYLPVMRERMGELKLVVLRYPKVRPSNVVINILLFCATILTTFAAGYFLIFGNIAKAALFSCAIMLMLGTHEMGHKIAAWRNGVESTLPYFIPAPNMLGTLGAVINIKGPIPTKEALVELGVAGPLSGFAMAIPLTILGLMLSRPDPTGLALPMVPAIFAIMQVGIFGYIPSGMVLNPLAFAGWVVLLLTMFNLIPAGWFDGGHVARGLMNRERHYTLTRTLGFTLFLTGIPFPEFPLWFWGFLIILLFRGYHPGALDDVSELSKRQKSLAAMALVVFLLCLPVPVG